jgi:pimeloyl-ACP methyl ester carboxylesterase
VQVPPQVHPENTHIPTSRHRGGMARLSLGHRALVLATRSLDAMAPDLTSRVMFNRFLRPRRKSGADYRSRLPAGAERLNLRHQGQVLTGWRWGQTGPAALLAHGWEDHSGSLLGFVEPLRARGYRVFALDAPGHGLSPGSATHLLDCSLALEAMVRAHGPFDSIIAHSFGATAVGVMLARSPRLAPSRLALISPMRDMEQHLEVFADIASLSPARTDRLRHLLTTHIGCAPRTLNAEVALHGLKVSGLVVHDRFDPVIPYAVGSSLARAWPGARLVSTENLGHRRVLACPGVLDAVLNLHQG